VGKNDAWSEQSVPERPERRGETPDGKMARCPTAELEGSPSRIRVKTHWGKWRLYKRGQLHRNFLSITHGLNGKSRVEGAMLASTLTSTEKRLSGDGTHSFAISESIRASKVKKIKTKSSAERGGHVGDLILLTLIRI